MIEKALGGESITHAMLTNDAMMSITAVEAFFAYGLKEDGSDVFIMPKFATELCEKYMSENGYTATVKQIQDAVKRDMGFLFQVS